jgi:uncharacterized membrane protein YvbJ
MRTCSNCGAQLGESWKFCTRCGTPVAAELAQQFPPPEVAYLRLEIVRPGERRVAAPAIATVTIALIGVTLIVLVILLLLAPHA